MLVSNLKIFLMEKDSSFAENLELYLGVHNEITHTSSIALDKEILQREFNLYLLNVDQSEECSASLIQSISQKFPKSPILLLSTKRDYFKINKYLALGATDYLFKSDHLIAELGIRIPILLNNKEVLLETSDQSVSLPQEAGEITNLAYKLYLKKCRQAFLRRGLELCQNNIKILSKKIGMSPGTLYNYNTSMRSLTTALKEPHS